MEDALDHVRQTIGHNFYIEEGTPVELMQANYELESQIQQGEVTKFKEKNAELTELLNSRFYEIQQLQILLASKQEEVNHLTSENVVYILKVAKHRKEGVLYCNRS